MSPRIWLSAALSAALYVGVASAAHAQAASTTTPAVPCRGNPCVLTVDWGVGKTTADMPPDRKYGAPEDFGAGVREALQGHNMLALGASADAVVTIRIQATYKTRVLCEDMPGTMPDRTCATIGEGIANLSTTDPSLKVPTSIRLTNRCGASGGVMSMKRFGIYLGDMIWYNLEGEQLKASKPMNKC